MPVCPAVIFFFFNDTATTEIYTLSLHDALPISCRFRCLRQVVPPVRFRGLLVPQGATRARRQGAPGSKGRRSPRSEEHTSELQSRSDLVCRLLLEKKKKTNNSIHHLSLTYAGYT